ncbi:MAG: nitroreductase [Alphaproteobacteria bacterium]
MTNALALLHERRSVKAKDMVEPGPDAAALDAIMRAGHRVPDHGKLGPWRFIVFEGDARIAFGKALAQIYGAVNPEMGPDTAAAQAGLPVRAPLMVAVIFSPSDAKPIPEWEQIMSTGAVCQNMLLAAHAQGYVGQWLTEWMAFEPKVATHLGLKKGERVAGFLYFGTAADNPAERERPDLAMRISHYDG